MLEIKEDFMKVVRKVNSLKYILPSFVTAILGALSMAVDFYSPTAAFMILGVMALVGPLVYLVLNSELVMVLKAMEKMNRDLQENSTSKRYLDCVLESIKDSIIITDLDGNVLSVNRAARENLNIGDISGINFKRFADEDLVRAIVRCEKSIVDYEVCLRSLDGNVFPAVVTGSIVTTLNQENKVLFAVRDISQKKQIERDLEHVSMVSVSSSRMAALGEIAGGVAHEINNPIAIINAMSCQLREVVQEGRIDKPMIAEMAAAIEGSSMRIARVVKGLRSFTRDVGSEPFVVCRLSQVIDDTIVLCAAKFALHNVKLTVTHDVDPQIECRPAELSQVLLSLINNSFDAVNGTKEGWIKIHVTQGMSAIEVSVTDSGRGLSPVVEQKLFQPFFTTKPIGKGTGLGLGISKRIIESHKGQLLLDKSCKNTRFVIRLPQLKSSIGLKVAA